MFLLYFINVVSKKKENPKREFSHSHLPKKKSKVTSALPPATLLQCYVQHESP